VLNIAATREEASELIKNYELEMQLNQDGALKDEAAWSSSANALPILTAAGIHDKDVQAKDSTIDIKAVGSDLDLEEADWDEDDWDEDTDDIGDEEWNEEDEADGDWDEDDWDEDDFDAAYVEDFDDDDV
jgi:hypothetical protein